MSTELAKLCEGCTARDNPLAEELIGELCLRGIICHGPERNSSPFASVSFNHPTRVIVTCGINRSIEQALLTRGVEPTDELIDQIGSGDFSVLD